MTTWLEGRGVEWVWSRGTRWSIYFQYFLISIAHEFLPEEMVSRRSKENTIDTGLSATPTQLLENLERRYEKTSIWIPFFVHLFLVLSKISRADCFAHKTQIFWKKCEDHSWTFRTTIRTIERRIEHFQYFQSSISLMGISIDNWSLSPKVSFCWLGQLGMRCGDGGRTVNIDLKYWTVCQLERANFTAMTKNFISRLWSFDLTSKVTRTLITELEQKLNYIFDW